jgi:uroporphyrinogen decarboxylase
VNGTTLRYVPEINSIWEPTPYVPVDPDKAKEFLRSHWGDLNIPDQETVTIRRIAKELKGKRFIIGVVQGTFLEPFSTHMLPWLHRYPDLLKLWLEYYLRINMERAKVKIDAGADAMMENDDYGTTSGPMIAPRYFKEFVVPNLRKLAETVHKKGAFFIKHTDGNINLLLEDIVSTGIDGLHPLEKQAGMDIGKVKKVYGEKICVLGNVHSALGGPRKPDYVVQETIDCIRAAAPGGGYIMTTSNVITPDAQEENFRAWIETTRKYGRYPIK